MKITHPSIKGQTVVISSYEAEFDENGIAEVPEEIGTLVVGKYGYELVPETPESGSGNESGEGKGQASGEGSEKGKGAPAAKTTRKPAGGAK